MKFVADTNVLFTLEEINKHAEEILEKTGISIEKFKELRRDLGIFVEFIPSEEYKEYLKHALELIPEYPDDIEFIALALKLELPIWSNDPHLKQQSKVRVFSTSEMIKELNL